MHVSEDGTEIHIRRYDSPKDYVGAKAFLMGRWLFTVRGSTTLGRLHLPVLYHTASLARTRFYVRYILPHHLPRLKYRGERVDIRTDGTDRSFFAPPGRSPTWPPTRLHTYCLRTPANTNARTHSHVHAHVRAHGHTHCRRTHARTHSQIHTRTCARTYTLPTHTSKQECTHTLTNTHAHANKHGHTHCRRT